LSKIIFNSSSSNKIVRKVWKEKFTVQVHDRHTEEVLSMINILRKFGENIFATLI
jgi:hypothetical protein